VEPRDAAQSEAEETMAGSSDRFDIGALLIGGVILFVGAYYFLDYTLGLDIGELNWNGIWPILVIAVGISILFGVRRRDRRRDVQ
jgi:hypothetical protein